MDEVQTGIGITGKWWAHEYFSCKPDIIAFGKKAQVCGMLANNRVDEVKQNVFSESSRINSTFGGNLTDKQLQYCANDVIYLHRIYEELNKILLRENRKDLYNKTVKFVQTRVELDLASFKEDIWSH